MKVLIVTPDYPPDIGGMAAHVYNLARTLKAHDHEVTVAFLKPNSPRDSVQDVDGVEVHTVRSVYKIGPVGFSMSRFKARRVVNRLAKEKDVDVVHIHGHRGEALATKGLPRRIPVVGTMHSSRFLRDASTSEGKADVAKRISHLCVVTAPSREICGVVTALSLDAGACTYIPNGVDTERFHPGIAAGSFTEELGVPDGNKVVLCARRIVEKNGVIYLAKAARQILDANSDTAMVFAGTQDADYGSKTRTVLSEAGVLDACVFTGSVPNDRMPELFCRASVSVLPSLVEATSITALESMACGVAVVGTTVGGIPELIDSGTHGLLVPPADPDALAEAVTRTLKDRDLAKTLGTAARARTVEEFSWNVIAGRVEAVYTKALEEARGAA
jgi:glycosyltransferase involved in cell wall biosynthesis